jgi:protein involved in sex pheromone biosynthesis
MKKSTILGIVASTFIMVSCGNHEETAGEKLDQAIDNTEQVGDDASEAVEAGVIAYKKMLKTLLMMQNL